MNNLNSHQNRLFLVIKVLFLIFSLTIFFVTPNFSFAMSSLANIFETESSNTQDSNSYGKFLIRNDDDDYD